MWHLDLIPKIVHFYLGSKTLSYLKLLSILSFHDLNPDWEIRCYYPAELHDKDNDINVVDYSNYLDNYPGIIKKCFNFRILKIRNDMSEVLKSYYLRYYLLWTVGGVWSDLDIIYHKPMNDFSLNKVENKKVNTFVCLNNNQHKTGFLLSSRGNIYYQKLYMLSLKALDLKDIECLSSTMFKKNNLLTTANIKNVGSSLIDLKNIDNNIIYPVDVEKIFNTNEYVDDLSIGLNWYSNTSLAKEYESKIDNITYLNNNNIITTVIKKYQENASNIVRDTNDNYSNWYLDQIPKKAHFFWDGVEFPYIRMMSIVSFYELNPDWEVNFYYPSEVYTDKVTWKTGELNYEVKGNDYYDYFLKNYPNINKIRFDFNKIGIGNIPPSFKSEFMKWYSLSNYGGLWSDMDIFYIKPMNEFYKNRSKYKDVTTFICLNGCHSVGFLLSSKDNAFYKNIFDNAKSRLKLDDYQSAGSYLFSRLGFDDINNFKTSYIENMDMDIVYPLNSRKVDLIFNSNNFNLLTDRTIGVHWYAGHKLSAKYINELTDQNYINYDNTLTQCIKYYNNKILNNNNFVVIATVKNGEIYVNKCIESVINQNYKNWKMIVVNDCSTDNSLKELQKYKDKITIINNKNTKTKIENVIEAINTISDNEEDIIVMVDGDDWLASDDVFSYLNKIYNNEDIWITYGQFEPTSRKYSNYCKEIKDIKNYRKECKLFLTSHLKTFKKKLWDKINIEDFKGNDGKFYNGADDAAFMFPMLEMSGKHSKFIDRVLYIYNDLNHNCQMYLSWTKQENNFKEICNKKQYEPIEFKPKVSILITTFKRTNLLKWNLLSLYKQKLNKKYDLEVIILDEYKETEEIINLINSYLDLNIKYINTGKNKKSPDHWRVPGYAINIGVKQCKGDYIILSCAEMYSLNDNNIELLIKPLINQDKLLTIPNFAKDDSSIFLDFIEKNNGLWNQDCLKNSKDLNILLPFFMGMRKEDFITVGGYDERFSGICRDDDDLVRRLNKNGCKHLKVEASVVHLYHERIHDKKNEKEIKDRIDYNDKIYKENFNIIKVNLNKEWGKWNEV